MSGISRHAFPYAFPCATDFAHSCPGARQAWSSPFPEACRPLNVCHDESDLIIHKPHDRRLQGSRCMPVAQQGNVTHLVAAAQPYQSGKSSMRMKAGGVRELACKPADTRMTA